VGATGFNHVSIHARNLEESTRFYVEVLGMQMIPTYDFAFPVQYLRLGDLQLHLFERDTDAPPYHHIAVNVDDFEATYLRAKELGILERESFFEDMYEPPDGACGCTSAIRPGILSRSTGRTCRRSTARSSARSRKLGDSVPQTGDALRATVDLDKAAS
jgi:hypothetical protein